MVNVLGSLASNYTVRDDTDEAAFSVEKSKKKDHPMRFYVFCLHLSGRGLACALGLWVLGALSSPGSHAQITGPEGRPLAGPNYIVPADLGEIRGANLFHRFLAFNVDTGERAIFIGPDEIANIIALINGDHPSYIDGEIRSDIPDANLFLLNPNGVVFGESAELSVRGSFHVSTADGVRFADDTVFTGDLGDEGSLTVAPPVAFGFVRDRPSPVQPIAFEGSNLRVPPGETFSVVVGDIAIEGSSLLASGGTINLISVGTASQGDVRLDASGQPRHVTEGVEQFGVVAISSGTGISTSGNGGGRIVIRGGQLTVEQSTLSSVNTGNLARSAGGIHIDATGTLQLGNGALVLSAAIAQGMGGNIDVMAHAILITDGASIVTSGSGLGHAGQVQVHAETSITIRDTSERTFQAGIFSFAGFDSHAGSVKITGERLVMQGGAVGTAPNITTGRREPRSGGVEIDVGHLILTGGAQIDSSTLSNFDGGTVRIVADVASLSEGSVITVGTAGNLSITAGRLTLQDGAEIASASRGSGDAGTIRITANEIRLSDSTVTTSANQADGGNIEIKADTLRLNNSAITAAVDEERGGGNIAINSDLVLLENSEIIARAAEGMGGNIGIMAKGFVADATTVIDASSDEGVNGTVAIKSIIDLSENIAQLTRRFAEPIPLLEAPCTERLRGRSGEQLRGLRSRWRAGGPQRWFASAHGRHPLGKSSHNPARPLLASIEDATGHHAIPGLVGVSLSTQTIEGGDVPERAGDRHDAHVALTVVAISMSGDARRYRNSQCLRTSSRQGSS